MEKNYHESEMIEDGQLYIVKIDDVTGDVISKTPAKKRRDTSNYFKKGEFFTMHERLCKMLKLKKDYNNLTFRLLFELLDRVEFNNRIRTFRQTDLAKILEAHQPHVSASLKVLKDDKIIVEKEHDYYFTPQFIKYVNDGNFSHLTEETT